jgi:hypothetical protein
MKLVVLLEQTILSDEAVLAPDKSRYPLNIAGIDQDAAIGDLTSKWA